MTPRLSAEQTLEMAKIVEHYDRFVTFLRDWKEAELNSLPAVTENVAVSQGRCQVLIELLKLVEEAPKRATKF